MMIDKEVAFLMIKETFESLARSGTLDRSVDVQGNTVILGAGSPLDSIGFITFVTDLEDRIQSKTAQEHYLVLSDIGDFNINNPSLTVSTLAEYLVELVKKDQ